LIPVDFFGHPVGKNDQKSTNIPIIQPELKNAEEDFEELKKDDSEGSGSHEDKAITIEEKNDQG
jgi:hypothetical protein